MEVKLYDDKKGGWQSWEAILEGEELLTDGYGENAVEALSELKTNVETKINELKEVLVVIDNLSVTNK